MPVTGKSRRAATSFAAAASVLTSVLAPAQQPRARARFEIVVPAELQKGPLTGRAYVMISRTNDREPRFQIGRTGIPFYGHDFERLAPGTPVVIDGSDLGHQVDTIDEIPAGDYFVQATAVDKAGNTFTGPAITFRIMGTITPTSLGTANNNGPTTSITSPTFSGMSVSAARTIFVTIAMDGGTGTVSVADSAGNTYTKDADVTNWEEQ